jgi:hypothetical protein
MNPILRIALAAVATTLAAAAWPVAAQDETAVEETAAERLAALQAEYEKAQEEYRELYRKAESDEEKQRLYEERYPHASLYAPRFLALAKEFPKDESAVKALGWVLRYGRGEEELNPALDLLLKNYLEAEALAPMCAPLRYSDVPRAGTFLRTLLEKSPHEKVRGQACYCLAHFLQRRARFAESAAKMSEKGIRPPDYAKYDDVDPEADRAEAEELLERVVAEFGALEHYRGDLAAAAKGDLFEMRELVVGKPAPEIEGEDIDGVPFKLSDYRGKVIFLDFWGNW